MIKRIVLGVFALGLPYTLGRAIPTAGAGTSLRQISPDECKQELDRLRMVVEACAQEVQQRTTAPKACDPSLSGSDEIVLIGAGKRRLQYDWLRDSLQQAAAAENAKHEQSAISNALSGLSDARARLEQMTQELAKPPASVYGPGRCCKYPTPARCHSRERRLPASQTAFLPGKDLERICALAVEVHGRGDAYAPQARQSISWNLW